MTIPYRYNVIALCIAVSVIGAIVLGAL